VNLLNIYLELYLDPHNIDTDRDEIMETMIKYLAQGYISKLEALYSGLKKNKNEAFRLSEIRFLILYMNSFKKEFSRFMKVQTSSLLSQSDKNGKKSVIMPSNADVHQRLNMMTSKIEMIYNEIADLLTESGNPEYVSIVESTETASSSKSSIRISKYEAVFRFRNTLSTEAYNYYKAWKLYVQKIISSQDSRKYINEEYYTLVEYMYRNLTYQDNYTDALVNSFKKFIISSINYVYSCEKANWTLYIIIFIFRIHSLLLNK